MKDISRPREYHGMSDSREYSIWNNMINRCYNTKVDRYPNYGGRGIRVCDRWRNSFLDFYSDMGPCPDGMSIERKDVNGNYEPSNCVWADDTTQKRNTTATRYLTYGGLTLSLAEWCERTGLMHCTILMRLNREPAWSIGQALGFEPAPNNPRGAAYWALKKQQDPELAAALTAKRRTEMRNTKRNRFLTYNGETKTAVEWSEITGVKSHTILKRLDNSATVWTIGQAIGLEPPPKLKTRWG